MKKIKIVFIETNCKKNGPIKQTLYIIKYLDLTIFEPYLITIWSEEEDNTMLQEYRNLGVEIYCCNLNKFKSILLGKLYVTKILKRINPDIVQGVGMPLYRMSLGYKDAEHFITLRNYCYEDYPDQYNKGIGTIMAYMDMSLIRRKLKKDNCFVTCSESLTEIYEKEEKLYIPYIRNGVDVVKYPHRHLDDIETYRKKLGIPLEKKVFIYSGNLIDRKNQREAIDAYLKMTRRNEALLMLLGDGKDRGKLEELYGNQPGILIKGKVNNVYDYLVASDVYLSTSKSEGLPNGVLEAMAVGLPVLLSGIPQHIEILNTSIKAGYSYTLGNVNELTCLMDSMLSDNLLEMGNTSYNSVMMNFTAQKMSGLYQKKYKEMYVKRCGEICDE